MKHFISVILLILSFNAYSLRGYDSLTDNQKAVLKIIVSQLGIKDIDNSLKYKIYNKNTGVYNGQWDSYWLGLAELSASKLKNGKEKGFIEIGLNHNTEGTVFLTYIYKPEVKQITIMTKQIRYGSKKLILSEFGKCKENTELYEVRNESSNYGMLQEKGLIAFEYFHAGSEAGSLVYCSQNIINL